MLDDLRDAMRHLRRRSGPALVTAAALALGVGSATAVFSVVDGVLLRPLPFPEPERLMRLYESSRETGLLDGPSPLNYLDWTAEARSFAQLAALYARPATLRGDGVPEAVDIAEVAPAFFELLGLPFAAGRGFDAATEVGAVVDEIVARYPVDPTRVGYYGYSLGAMLGVSAVANDDRFRAAVFAAVGTGPLSGPAEGAGSHLPALAGVAVRVVAKAEDELIPSDATDALYAGLPGEKDLVTLPGGHFAVGPDVAAAAAEWLAAKL